MIKQTLNGKWLFKEFNQKQWYEATVPGTVYTDLLNNHLMENPYWNTYGMYGKRPVGKCICT